MRGHSTSFLLAQAQGQAEFRGLRGGEKPPEVWPRRSGE